MNFKFWFKEAFGTLEWLQQKSLDQDRIVIPALQKSIDELYDRVITLENYVKQSYIGNHPEDSSKLTPCAIYKKYLKDLKSAKQTKKSHSSRHSQ